MRPSQPLSPFPEPLSDHGAISYLPTLDGLRGVAILLVLWYHAPFLFRDLPQFSAQQSPWSMLGVFGIMSLGGWIGVDLFFVISGFLITSILMRVKNGAGSSMVFWGRRGLRILPLAGLYLSVLFILTWLGDPLNLMPRFDGWAWYLLYLGNIHIAINGWQPLAVMIMWSLAIEEQFYVAWPLLVRSVSGSQLLWWSIGLMVAAPLVRAYTLSIADYPATYVFTLCRLDALAVGALMAVLFGTRAWRDSASRLCGRLVLPASGLIVITLLIPFSPSFPQTRPWWFSIFGYSWLAMSFGVCLGASLDAQGSVRSVLTSPLLAFLGKRCYGLYLWHVLVAALITSVLQPLELGFYLHVILWFVALLIIASGSWLLFEEPILRLKRLIPYENRQQEKVESSMAA